MGITHCNVRLNLDVPTNIQFSVVAKTELWVADSRCFSSTRIVSSACACVLSPPVNEYSAFPASSSTKIFFYPVQIVFKAIKSGRIKKSHFSNDSSLSRLSKIKQGSFVSTSVFFSLFCKQNTPSSTCCLLPGQYFTSYSNSSSLKRVYSSFEGACKTYNSLRNEFDLPAV